MACLTPSWLTCWISFCNIITLYLTVMFIKRSRGWLWGRAVPPLTPIFFLDFGRRQMCAPYQHTNKMSWNGPDTLTTYCSYGQELKMNVLNLSCHATTIIYISLLTFQMWPQIFWILLWNWITTTLHRKETTTNSLLHFSSFHPYHLKKGVPTG